VLPDIVQAQGQPIDSVKPRFEGLVRDRCGGKLCVKVRVEPRDVGNPDVTRCQFWELDPPAGTKVERDSSVVLVVGTAPCVAPTPTVEATPGGA
jgi:hypothetical protein